MAGGDNLHGPFHTNFLMKATECVSKIPSNTIRSHLNIHRSNILNLNEQALVRRAQSDRVMCKYCLTPWKNGFFSLKLQPKVKTGKKMRKILRRIEENKRVSLIQKKLAEAVHSGNTVAIRCQTCQKVSTIKTGINKNTKENVHNTPGQLLTPVTPSKSEKKKKKKKKNQFCGLNASVMREIHSKKKEEMKKKGKLFSGNDVADKTTAVSSDRITPESLKRKLDKVPDMSQSCIAKHKKVQKNDGSGIKANPLPITPLGAKTTPVNIKSRTDNFIPLTSGGDGSSGMKNKSLYGRFDTPHRPGGKYNKSKGQKFINPFATPSHGQTNMTNSGRKNRWKKLIAEEEKDTVQGCSLKDFLSTL